MEMPLQNQNLITWMKAKWPLWVILVAAFWVLLRTAWMCDDGFISFTSAANLVEGKGFTFQAGERLQTFSNPFWTLLGALAYAFTNEVWRTGMVMGIVTTLLSLTLLFSQGYASKPKTLLLGFLVLLSSAFIDFSTSGLENPMSHLLVLLFALQFLKACSDSKWLRNLTLLASLLMLNRPDLLIVVGPACLFAFFASEKKGKWQAVLLGLLPILLWEAFSLTYYGFLLPNTWYAKLGVADGRWMMIGKGWIYFWNCLRRDPLTILIILTGFFSAIVSRDRKLHLLMLGAALYMLGVIYAGGDYMQGRMFTVPFVLSVFVILKTPLPKWTPIPAFVLVLIGLLRIDAPIYCGPNYHVGRVENPKELYSDMITDERAVCWRAQGWISNHGETKHPMRVLEENASANRAGEAWKMPVQSVRMVGAIGMRGYEAEPGIRLLDELALAEVLLARLPALETRWWRAGHRVHVIPAGYEAHLSDARHPLDDANLNKYVQDLELVTRGPIWSGARWKAIWRFLSGQNGKLIDFERYRKGYVEVQANAQAPILENAAHADRWKPICLHFSAAQHWEKLEIHAKSGGELWFSFGGDDNLVQASLLPKTDSLQDFDVFLLDVSREIAVPGFSDLVLRGEALTPDLWVFGVEGKE